MPSPGPSSCGPACHPGPPVSQIRKCEFLPSFLHMRVLQCLSKTEWVQAVGLHRLHGVWVYYARPWCREGRESGAGSLTRNRLWQEVIRHVHLCLVTGARGWGMFFSLHPRKRKEPVASQGGCLTTAIEFTFFFTSFKKSIFSKQTWIKKKIKIWISYPPEMAAERKKSSKRLI